MSFSPPALITAQHRTDNFDCGAESLNQYLKRFALTNAASGTARTYVTTSGLELLVMGYDRWRLVQWREPMFPNALAKEFQIIRCQWFYWPAWRWTGLFKAKALGRGFCGMRYSGSCRRPILSEFARSLSTPRTEKRQDFMRNSDSFLPRQIRST